ncbi:YbaB/EbfC family nucleoid-associated protein [Nocardia sp. NBC_01503]|uniref:YbaB/EbfC family nucleoid-associated protein n=1 Tax=Nocardia sp. NBC_01503 TaxID=2975997 RepID=UPI002E7C4AC0|nr:YbaB/EbfC family nucleoid-associated protein [Nocardia sp. NBC_01503]WTL33275.1 YbaB/EbfC family nucleoid-associated protein [Nocardia sp. NBC_01503]
MTSQASVPSGFTESLGTKMDRLADALSNNRASIRADGVYVDVYANGTVRAVVIDSEVISDVSGVGQLIADLINRAREQAQQQMADLVREVSDDPRIASVVEQIGDAPQRPLPTSLRPTESWDDGDDPWRPRSPIAAD